MEQSTSLRYDDFVNKNPDSFDTVFLVRGSLAIHQGTFFPTPTITFFVIEPITTAFI